MASSGDSGNSNTGNSNGGNSNTGNSNTGNSSGSDASSGGQGTNIDNLKQGLKDIQKSGQADLKLSTETRDKYVKIISTYRTALKAERDKMNNQESLGDPGALQSAILTKQDLQLAITGLEGAQRSVDKYLTYLDELETTVKKACDRLIKSG